jgi:hypothetical protein
MKKINNIIIIKTKILLPQAWITLAEFGNPVEVRWFIVPEDL